MCLQNVRNVFGYTLRQGVLFVGYFTMVSSVAQLVVSAALECHLASKHLNRHLLLATSFLVLLAVISLSVYQLVVSSLLAWQARWTAKGRIYLCSLWYVSHVAILTVYTALGLALAAACYAEQRPVAFVATIACFAAYDGIFIYFCIIVNCYIQSMNVERYF